MDRTREGARRHDARQSEAMRSLTITGARLASLVLAGTLAACGGGADDATAPAAATPVLKSYVGSTGTFVAWADPATGRIEAAPTGAYAGKRSVVRGTVDYLSGASIGRLAGVQVYKRDDGHVYALGVAAAGTPAERRISSESEATVDDDCSLNGTAVAGANTDYAAVQFAVDLERPARSAYIYRLPGADGACNTADDVVHAVFTGMSDTEAPLTLPGMPSAVVRTDAGGITGYLFARGNRLELWDATFARPVVLGAFASTVGVVQALPNGSSRGRPTREAFLVDGALHVVDYAARSVSAPLFKVPGWQPTAPGALFAASPTRLFFSIHTPAAGSNRASSTIYAMPSDGSSAPIPVVTEAGRIVALEVPVDGTQLVWSLQTTTLAIRTTSTATPGTPVTLVDGGAEANNGTFIATADAVYYTLWLGNRNASNRTNTRQGTFSGIVGYDASMIQPKRAGSAFVNGGELQPWPDDPAVTQTAWRTLLQVRGLSPISTFDPVDGFSYTQDGVAGATLVAIDAATKQEIATPGVLPASTAQSLAGTFRSAERYGFIEATNAASNGNPATRDLYFLNPTLAGSLVRVTGNL